MADSVQVQYRPYCVEDFYPVAATFAQVPYPVLGIGFVPLTPLVGAVNDAAAATAGVPVGGVYVCQPTGSFNYLRTRMS